MGAGLAAAAVLGVRGWAVWFSSTGPCGNPSPNGSACTSRRIIRIGKPHPQRGRVPEGHGPGSSIWMIEQFSGIEQFTRRVSFADLLNTDTLVKRCWSRLFLPVTQILAASPRLDSRVLSPVLRVRPRRPRLFLVEPGDAQVRGRPAGSIGEIQPGGISVPSAGGRAGSLEHRGDGLAAGRVYHTFPNLRTTWITGSVRPVSSDLLPRHRVVSATGGVDRPDLHLPGLSGHGTERVPNGGAISAVEGTRVRIAAWVNQPLRSAELVCESRRAPAHNKPPEVMGYEIALTENGSCSVISRTNGEPASTIPYEIR